MKQIIDGLLYDTDNAELIYTDTIKNRRYYKASHGAYFVVYRNGEISPKTEDEIKDILGKSDIDKYIELFGEPEPA